MISDQEELDWIAELSLCLGALVVVPERSGMRLRMPTRPAELLELTHLEAERRACAAALETEAPPFSVIKMGSLWMLEPPSNSQVVKKKNWRHRRPRKRQPEMDWRVTAMFTTRAEAEQWGREVHRGQIPAYMKDAATLARSRAMSHDTLEPPAKPDKESLVGPGHSNLWASLRLDFNARGPQLPDARTRRARRLSWLAPHGEIESEWLLSHGPEVSSIVDVCADWWGRARHTLAKIKGLDQLDSGGIPGWVRDLESVLITSLVVAGTGGRSEFSEDDATNDLSEALHFAAAMFVHAGMVGRVPASLPHHVVQALRSLARALGSSGYDVGRECAFAMRVAADRLEHEKLVHG